MFHAKADMWCAIIDLNFVYSITFLLLLLLLNEDSAVASTAKTSAPITGSSSSSGHSGSGVASFGMGFAGTDDNDGKDGARLLLPSSPKLVLLC